MILDGMTEQLITNGRLAEQAQRMFSITLKLADSKPPWWQEMNAYDVDEVCGFFGDIDRLIAWAAAQLDQPRK